MTLFYHYVIAFFSGGCCVMVVSAIVLVVWAIKNPAGPMDRARVVDPSPPSLSLTDVRPIGRQHAWFD